MTSRTRVVVLVCVVVLCLVLTEQIARGLGIERAVGLLSLANLATLVISKLLPRPDGADTPGAFAVAHSWRRALAYGSLLAATTLITTPIALQHHWHINGLWLILTPFLVLRPFVRDAWRVAIHRSLGTLAGVGLVILVAPALPHTLPLQVPAIALAAITAAIAARQGHPALMVTVLTATIVLFNSNASDLSLMADKRLLACAIGISISLGVMALAHPFEQRFRAVRAAEGS